MGEQAAPASHPLVVIRAGSPLVLDAHGLIFTYTVLVG
jgi:hypothetical protein